MWKPKTKEELWKPSPRSSGSPPPNPEPTSTGVTRPRQESIRQPFVGRRFAQIVKLKPEFVGKYKEVHAAVWPEVLKQIRECNIRDCESLFFFFPCHIRLFFLVSVLCSSCYVRWVGWGRGK
jgi:hypothetical protein